MARLNRRLFVIILGVLVLLGGSAGALVLIARSPAIQRQALLRSAEEYQGRGNYTEAIVACLRGIGLDRTEPRFYEIAGECYLKVGNVGDGIRAYARLAALRPGSVPEREKVCELCAQHGDLKGLSAMAEEILKTDPKHAQAHIWAATACAARRDLGRAIEHLQNALQIGPDRIEVYATLAALQEAKGEIRQTDRTYQKALEKQGKSAPLRIAYGGFLGRNGRQDEAEAMLRSAVDLAPQDTVPELALARFYLAIGRRAQAEERFLAARKKNPQDPVARLDYGKFLFVERKFAEARTEFETLLENGGTETEAREWLAEIALALDKPDDAQALIAKIPDALAAKRPRALSVRGRLLLARGKPWDAIAALERSVAAAPSLAECHLFLGTAFWSVREEGTALACFHEACRLAPGNDRYQLWLGRAELVLGQHGPALQRARTVLGKDKAEPEVKTEARLLLAQCYAVLGDTENTGAAVKAISGSLGDDVAQQIQLAALYISQNRTAQAQQLLQQYLTKHKDSLPAVSALAQTYVLQGKAKDAEDLLLGAMKTSPGALAPAIRYAQLCLARGDKDNAKLHLQRLLDSNPERLENQRAMASFYIATGDVAEALKTYAEAEKKKPDDVDIKAATFSLLLHQRKFDEAARYAAEIKRIEPRSVRALLAEPRLHLAKGELKEALPLLEDVVKKRPHEWMPQQLLGGAYGASGDIPRAVEHLKKAVGISPGSDAARLALADAYYRSNMFGLALAETQRVLRSDPSSRAAHVIAAYSLTAERSTEEAIREWNAFLELGEGRASDYVALGKLYLDKDQLGPAEKAFKKAHELTPKSPIVGQALAHLYRIRGEPAQAERVLEKLIESTPKDPVGHLLLGEHFRLTKNLSAAEKEFNEAVAASPKSPGCHVVLGNFQFVTGRTEEAIASYRRALELSKESSDARMLLVRALVAARRLEEAEDLVESTLKANPNDVQALVQKAQIMLPRAYHCRDDASVQEAISLCQRALNERPDLADAHYVIAKAHVSQTNPQLLAAESAIRRALEIAPHEVHMRVDRAKLLFLLERCKEAETECREVLRVQPASFDALVVLADALLAAREGRQPLELAQELAAEFPKNPAAPFLIGRTLHRTEKLAEALSQYQRSFAIEKNSLLVLDGRVGCSLLLKRPKDAIAFCEEFIKNNPRSVSAHEMLANVFLAEKRFGDAEKALRSAADLNPVSLEPILALLQVYKQEKKGEAALAACQAYVKQWPDNPAGHAALGQLLLEGNRLDEAQQCFAKALKLNPRSFQALKLLVDCDVAKKDTASAVSLCEQFIKHNPGSALAYNLLGGIYGIQKDKIKANEYLNKAAAFAPRFVMPHLLLANLSLSDGNYDLAVKSYDDALNIDPGNPIALNNAAYLLADRGKDLDRADAMAKRLIARFPSDPTTLDTFGWVSLKRGENDTAIEAFQKSLAGRKDDPTTLYHLGVALLRKGDRTAARAAIEKALASNRDFPAAAEARTVLDSLKR